jgi:hypothetical protein
MEESSNNKERRNHPRFIIDLPFNYLDMNGSCLRGATLVSARDGTFLIETGRDIPVGVELSISVLFPKGYELANFKVMVKTVWRRSCWKRDWKGNRYQEGYQYGLEFIKISGTDRWKLNYLLGGRLQSEETSPEQSSQL